MSNVVSSHTIRTGDLSQDQRQLHEAQQYANANGLLMQVHQLPQGGFLVEMMRPAAPAPAPPPPAPVYGAPAPPYAQASQPPGGYGHPPLGGAMVPVGSFGGAQPRAISVAPSGTCRMCGRHAPTKQVTFHQNIGALIMRFPKTISGQLCRDCIGKYFRSYTLTSLFLGWWGVISFFYTLVTIPMNIVTYLQARSLPRA